MQMVKLARPLLAPICWVLGALVVYELWRLIHPVGQALAPFRPGPVEFHTSMQKTARSPLLDIEQRVDRIKSSQILGLEPARQPITPALLGIAGHDAFLRAPNGQTGLVRESEEFGGMRLLCIGTNRVLILYQGKTNELTVFDGFGSESLLSEKSK